MKMSKKIQATAKSLRAARLRMPKRASADAYAQLDRFLKGTDTALNGVPSKRGVPAKA
jgi:hypothetical protein